MTGEEKDMKRVITALMATALIVFAVTVTASTIGRRPAPTNEAASETEGGGGWEYLVVSSPSNINFSPSTSSGMRKEPGGPFGREAFLLEQHMDKLGAKGWELVAVTGNPSDPVYYFKRRK
jgi:hypothetical protein